ncbi:rab proteins geranylgeranyltransferase component A 1 [Galendromus occidentalis]|uniref:Rab proteins geranylgeranyltransferase component A n=1 Tax=Galendromus occidentalis TaxID=34638 RepID=A0AAJ6W0H6_9ACAR|nr:rab proteins geranylgeranyltransferase component A 1 [Galendromus occidentalis]
MDDLPREVDVIVLGTGVPESIVAAACARVGKSVLHFDHRSHYGSMFASFNFHDLTEILQTPPKPSDGDGAATSEDGLRFIQSRASPVFSNVEIEVNEHSEWSLEKLEQNSRKFNLDLAPKLLFARGKMVELLISSNIAKYAEFKLTSKILTLKGDDIVQVPCSRADVFATDSVNVVEKRALMRFITNVLDYENQPLFTEWLDKPFEDFIKLKALFLTENLQHFILHSIAMATPSTTTGSALEDARKFIRSLGRYGNSPFLSPIYGCGELAQCFCRLCAVFGGVYHLDRQVEGYFVDEDNRVRAVRSRGETFRASHVVINQDFDPSHTSNNEHISRAIVILHQESPIEEPGAGTLLRVPPGNDRPAVTVIEQGAGMMICPKNLMVAHFICRKVISAREDLKALVEKIYPSSKRVWVAYFNMIDTTMRSKPTTDDFAGLYLMSTPGLQLDYDIHIEQAEEVFRKMYPDEEFLPRAPDPDEIILDFEDGVPQQPAAEHQGIAQESGDGSESDGSGNPVAEAEQGPA